MHVLEAYMAEYSAEEHERPALAKIRENLRVMLHPDSEEMRKFERRAEDTIDESPETEFDPEAEFPFPGLSAPLGG